MSNKMYALYKRVGSDVPWSNAIAVSKDANKLTHFMHTSGYFTRGSYDVTNCPNIVCYSSRGEFPEFKVEGTPYVV